MVKFDSLFSSLLTRVLTLDNSTSSKVPLRTRLEGGSYPGCNALIMSMNQGLSIVLKVKMAPQLLFKIRNIADFGVELRLVIRKSAILIGCPKPAFFFAIIHIKMPELLVPAFF
jgi:hypothetical protein